MPSSILFNGRSTSRPGVYAKVVNNLGAAALPATGNLAVIGNFPLLDTAMPRTFNSRSEFDSFFSAALNSDMKVLADLAFSPFGAGGASIGSLTLVNAADATAASLDKTSIVYSAKHLGGFGNRISMSLALANDEYTIQVFLGGSDPVEEAVIDVAAAATIEEGSNGEATLTAVLDATKLTFTSGSTTREFARAEFPSLNAVLTELADSFGVSVSLAAPDISLADLDNFSSVDLAAGNTVSFTAKNAKIKAFCDASSYVSASIASYDVPTGFTKTPLAGGDADPSFDSTQLQTALDAIKRMPINTVVLMSESASMMQVVLTHCKDAAWEAGWERNAWFASAAASVAAGKSIAKQLNDPNAALAVQQLKVSADAGSRTMASGYTAVLLAAMQSALPAGASLTKKKPTPVVLSAVTNGSWDVESFAEAAIQGGLVVFTDPSLLGLSVERSVTCWLSDDNPIKSEVGANSSVNESVRQLRSAVRAKIGETITAAMLGNLEAVCQTALRNQRLDGLIFNFSDLTVSISGDTAQVSYSLQPSESLNFILITANITR